MNKILTLVSIFLLSTLVLGCILKDSAGGNDISVGQALRTSELNKTYAPLNNNWTLMLTVVNDEGHYLSNATVTFQEINHRPIIFKSSDKGLVKIKNVNPQSTYLIETTKEGYIGTRIKISSDSPESLYSFYRNVIQSSVKLTSVSSAIKLPSYIPTAILDYPHYEIFPTTGQEIRFTYYPAVSSSLLNNLESIDARWDINPQKNMVFPNQELNKKVTQIIHLKIKPNYPKTFKVKIDSGGVYNWNLSYTLNYKNGSKLVLPGTANNFYGGLKTFLVVPSLPEPKFQEVIPGHNDKNNLHRINVLFLRSDGKAKWSDAAPSEMELYHLTLQEMLKGGFGPFNVEPFKSNINNFNFWYTPEIININSLAHISDILSGERKIDDLDDYQKFVLGLSSLPNLIPVRVEADLSTGGKTCGLTNGIQIYIPIKNIIMSPKLLNCSLSQCLEYFPASRVLTHELGHYIARLPEEYDVVKGEGNIFFNSSFSENSFGFEDPNLGPMGDTTFYTGLINKVNDCTVGEVYVNCTPNKKAVDYCVSNARWKDLIGNGCGQDGVVDCPNDKLEVNCNYASGGWPGIMLSADVTKSTKSSIMDDKMHFLDQGIYFPHPSGGVFYSYYTLKNYSSYNGRFFGAVNERQLCRYIKLYTVNVGGVCNKLCLDGCSKEEKCILGICK